MQHKLIRRAAMFITSVLAMTVLFAVPVFAATCSAGGLTFTVEAPDILLLVQRFLSMI